MIRYPEVLGTFACFRLEWDPMPNGLNLLLLELQVKRKLDFTRNVIGAQQRSKCRVFKGYVGCLKVWSVQNIKDLGSKF